MRRTAVAVLVAAAIMIAHSLGGATMAFESPIEWPVEESAPVSPISSRPTAVPPTPTASDEPIYEYVPGAEPVEAIATPPFIPISPIFQSPLAAPVSLMCVTVAQASGQVLCYEVR